MRENRPYGSEGGVGASRSRPLSVTTGVGAQPQRRWLLDRPVKPGDDIEVEGLIDRHRLTGNCADPAAKDDAMHLVGLERKFAR